MTSELSPPSDNRPEKDTARQEKAASKEAAKLAKQEAARQKAAAKEAAMARKNAAKQQKAAAREAATQEAAAAKEAAAAQKTASRQESAAAREAAAAQKEAAAREAAAAKEAAAAQKAAAKQESAAAKEAAAREAAAAKEAAAAQKEAAKQEQAAAREAAAREAAAAKEAAAAREVAARQEQTAAGEAESKAAAAQQAVAKQEQAAAKEAAAAQKAAAKQEKAAAKEAAAARKAAAKQEQAAAKEAAAAVELDVIQEGAGEQATGALDTGTGAEVELEAAMSDADSKKLAKPAKKSGGKKLIKLTSKSDKPVHRTIRPVSSRGQRTTERLIWGVFGMALIIVAVVGIWVALSSANDEDPVVSKVLVAARSLPVGHQLAEGDWTVLERDVTDINHVLELAKEDVRNRVVTRAVDEGELLTLGHLGAKPRVPDEVPDNPNPSDYQVNLSHPSGSSFANEVSEGDRVVLLAVPAGSYRKYAITVVEVAGLPESGGVTIDVTFAERAWWQKLLSEYGQLADITFEFEAIENGHDALCWQERYRFIYDLNPHPNFPALLDELGCPGVWAVKDPVDEIDTSIIEATGQEPPTGGPLSEALRDSSYTDQNTEPPAALIDLLPKDELLEGEPVS